MQWLKSIWQKIREAIGLSEKPYRIQSVAEFEESTMRPDTLYLETRDGKDRWLYMKCPCGCGDTLTVNLMTSHDPYWVFMRNKDQTVSLSPSIWRKDACRSHFFLRHSRIEWAR